MEQEKINKNKKRLKYKLSRVISKEVLIEVNTDTDMNEVDRDMMLHTDDMWIWDNKHTGECVEEEELESVYDVKVSTPWEDNYSMNYISGEEVDEYGCVVIGTEKRNPSPIQ